jgi:integrase
LHSLFQSARGLLYAATDTNAVTLLRRCYGYDQLGKWRARTHPPGPWRHTFARVALEHGADLVWLSRHVGHSSTAVTDKVYGHFSRAARKRHMERLAEAFSA